jgi:small-conductance mechanosensitive channel/CHASE3 domain sensor protein
MLFAAGSFAQDAEESVDPAALDLTSLETKWWSEFEQPDDDTKSRVGAFLANIDAQIAELQAPNQAVGESILESVRDNFSAYLELLEEDAPKPKELPPPADSYSIEDLLQMAAIAREARAGAVQEKLEVEREQRILDGASETRDRAFKRYLGSEPGDARLLAALRLVQARLAQAISAQRVLLLTKSFERATAYAEATEARVTLASERLPATIDENRLDEQVEKIAKGRAAVEEAQKRLHAAEAAAARIAPDTPDGRLQQRLNRQKLIEAQVVAALADIELAQAHTLFFWAQLQLGTVVDIEDLERRSLAARELVSNIEERAPNWQRETENELLAVQTTNRDGLNRTSRRLLDQRLGTAQGTLNGISELQSIAADLELLILEAEKAFAKNVGPFRTWLALTSRGLKGIYLQVTELANVTLFSVGETPVAGYDILRVLVILFVAFLLSRLVRHAIGRLGERESAGTQASIYTVGRLSHYAIITVAVFVALSSIGLDFSNLALIAGALSVGIGFGLQSIVQNFISGLIILFEHSLRVGDYIELDTGLTGTVKSINVRSTLINTNDNIDIVVPNSEFVTTRLTNWTLGERILRIRIPFGVAYGSDKELVRKAAKEAAAEVPYTLTNMKGREPDVWLVEYGDNSLNFLLLVWVNRQGARRPTRSRAAYLWALESKLAEYGIEIPFPQRDLHLRSGWPEAEAPEPKRRRIDTAYPHIT